jgi:hypothetical protein
MFKSAKEIGAIRRRCNDVENDLIDEFLAGRITRREFLRRGVVLGISAPIVAGLADCADPPSYPLDLIPGAAFAYSFRKVRTAYAGRATRIQRSSDSTQQDIGFNGEDFNAAAYASFVGAGTGALATWYDQSGNANNASQATAAQMPAVNPFRGSIFGGKTTWGSNQALVAAANASFQDLWSAGGFIVWVVKLDKGSGWNIIAGTGTGTNGWVADVYNNAPGDWVNSPTGSTDRFDLANIASNSIPAAGLHVVTIAFNLTIPGTPATITLDGVVCGYQATSGGSGFTSDAGTALEIFNGHVASQGQNNFAAFGGSVYELMAWKSIPSAENQTKLLNNVRAYYGTP